MARPIQHLSLTLGARKPYLNRLDSTMGRLSILLHTPQGHLPWEPKFGCDFDQSIGRPATDELQNQISSSVRHSVSRWIPDTKINRCDVILQNATLNVREHREPTIPLAESALAILGTDVHAQVALEVEVDGEIIEMSTALDIE
ncbi:MAG: GPW/gp25 family protein [Myxococcota bacterium]|nr:GPW/gp25 family protein [Myxococcota bacterium]